jgi:TIR domain
MTFERHVFISYAHIDNQPLTPEQKGWVTLLHGALQTKLSQWIGGQADIWRDEKELRGNDIFSNEIVDQLLKTASIVSVLTPRYLNSEWCTREINEFCQSAQQTGGVVIKNQSRVFKVIKTPGDKVIKTPIDKDEKLPSVVREMCGYDFYVEEDNTPIELDPVYGEKSRGDFLRKVNKLAWDIAQLLLQLSAAGPRKDGPVKDETVPKPLIYLAECSRDRREAREILEGELERHGYAVLPDRQLPTDETDYIAEVQRLLERCRFSIHLIGSSYGLVPDGPSQKSVVALQNELAAKCSQTIGLRRMIWLPEGTRSESAPQQTLISALHQDAGMQFGADLITGDIEELKGAIHAALKKIEEQKQAPPPPPGHKMVYVLCDEKDRRDTVPLLKFLKGKGLEIKLPVFTGVAAQVREANQELFMTCDAVILFYGAGDEAWKFHQQNELKKIQGLRSEKPLTAIYTYLAGPATDDKELLLTLDEPNLINSLSGFSEPAMEAFLTAVGVSGAAR